VVWAGSLGPFLHTPPTCQDLQLRFSCFSVDVRLLCYAPDSHLTILTYSLTNFCNVSFSSACCWPSWSLFVSDTFSFLRKTCHPLVNWCFLHSIIPINLCNISLISLPLLPSLTRNLMFILTVFQRHTETHSDNNRHHSERDCHRSTTQLWNADTPSSSNHTEVSVDCCHSKHTASSWTLLADLVCAL
jgi:hypothetical protein